MPVHSRITSINAFATGKTPAVPIESKYVEDYFKAHKNLYGLIVCHAHNPLPLENAEKENTSVLKSDEINDATINAIKDDIIGEKDFFEFMKRANRDLTAHQRHVVLTITINALRGDNDK